MIYLASSSPRRRELLGQVGYEFVVRPSGYDEAPLKAAGLAPDVLVRELASAKALDVARALGARAEALVATASDARPNDVVIGADTVVVRDGVVLGKPHDERDAVAMLRSLSGRSHQVLTGVSVVGTAPVGNDAAPGDPRQGGGVSAVVRQVTFCETTTVSFYDLDEARIAAYVATGEPMDKAGSYGIQGLGALLVRGIEGDYCNVVGLPVARLARVLDEMGVPRGDAWVCDRTAPDDDRN
ncbi:MAG: Maf family protein [Coriobacteriales bacterium]|jgi:septum formation protein